MLSIPNGVEFEQLPQGIRLLESHPHKSIEFIYKGGYQDAAISFVLLKLFDKQDINPTGEIRLSKMFYDSIEGVDYTQIEILLTIN